MKWIGQHIWSFISRFRSDVYLESIGTSSETNVLVVDSDGKITKNTAMSGDVTGVTAGTGLSGGGSSGDVTLNVEASQTQVTAVGNITTGGWRGTAIGTAYGGTGLTTVGTNEILTGNGGGSALTSESTLTYNSAVLQLQNVAAGVLINDTTTSSAQQGGSLVLASDDGAVMADNHRLGVIEFKGAEDASNTLSTGALIQAITRDAWDGSNNDADLEFYTTDGTTKSKVLTLDADKLATFTGAVTVTGALTGTLATASQPNITTVGTIGTGTWEGGVIDSDYLDTDTAHLSATQTFTGQKTINSRVFAITGATHGEGVGDIIYIGDTATTAGKIYYLRHTGVWAEAVAGTTTTSISMLGVALGSNSTTNGILIRGMVTLSEDIGGTENEGIPLYLSTTSGAATATAPSSSNNVVRVIGYSMCAPSSPATGFGEDNQIWFNPDNTWVEIT
jgi:hypothetical protein